MIRRDAMAELRRRVLLLGVVVVALAAGPVSAAERKGRQATAAGLVAADSARFRAMVDRDMPALERGLADELVYVHSMSLRQTKAEHLLDVKAGRAIYLKIDVREQEPYLYGSTGVIHGVATFMTGGERKSTFTLRYTDVYVRRDGRWQMVAFSCSRMPEEVPAQASRPAS